MSLLELDCKRLVPGHGHLWFETVRGALSSPSTEVPGSPVEAFDRLGQVARFGRRRGYSNA